MRYIAFLRGINIGGRKILMEDLQQVFEAMGFTNIKTLIASGNVLFNTSENNEVVLTKGIEESLEKHVGFAIPVMLRTKEELENLIAEDPFKNIVVEQGTRLQITLFDSELNKVSPIQKKGFAVVYVGKRELGSVVYLTGKTTDLMTFIDKNFGKDSTTRNWNTLQKLLKM